VTTGSDWPAASASVYAKSAAAWSPATPYLHPWHAKRNFGVDDQIRRECAERGLPDPIEIRSIDSIEMRRRERRAIHFHRFRSKRGLRQPDRRGTLVRIRFPEPIEGPHALGFACHYGLGMFRPET
jgi:CRISPR-associated protein Csb2